MAGRTEIEDVLKLKKPDKLTYEVARMAAAQDLSATQNVDDWVKGVDAKVASVGGESKSSECPADGTVRDAEAKYRGRSRSGPASCSTQI